MGKKSLFFVPKGILSLFNPQNSQYFWSRKFFQGRGYAWSLPRVHICEPQKKKSTQEKNSESEPQNLGFTNHEQFVLLPIQMFTLARSRSFVENWQPDAENWSPEVLQNTCIQNKAHNACHLHSKLGSCKASMFVAQKHPQVIFIFMRSLDLPLLFHVH